MPDSQLGKRVLLCLQSDKHPLNMHHLCFAGGTAACTVQLGFVAPITVFDAEEVARFRTYFDDLLPAALAAGWDQCAFQSVELARNSNVGASFRLQCCCHIAIACRRDHKLAQVLPRSLGSSHAAEAARPGPGFAWRDDYLQVRPTCSACAATPAPDPAGSTSWLKHGLNLQALALLRQASVRREACELAPRRPLPSSSSGISFPTAATAARFDVVGGEWTELTAEPWPETNRRPATGRCPSRRW